MIFKQITILILLANFTYGRRKWINPHSMDDDPGIYLDCNCPENNCQQDENLIFRSYYRRTVSLLLNSLEHDLVTKEHTGELQINLSEEDFNYIQSFLQQKNIDLNKIDQILTKTFQRRKDYTKILFTWLDYSFYVLFSKECFIIIGAFMFSLFLYNLYRQKITLFAIFVSIVFILWIVDFVYIWIYLLKEAELEQMLHVAYKVPPECDIKKMGWMEYMKHWSSTFVGNDRCKEYHKIKDIDAFWTVSTTKVLGMQFGNLIVTPAENIGIAIAKINNGVFTTTSWFALIPSLIFTPILLFGFIILMAILMSFLTRRTFEFDFFRLFSFKFGTDAKANRKERTIYVPIREVKDKKKAMKANNEGNGDKKKTSKDSKVAKDLNKSPPEVLKSSKKDVEDVK